MIGHGKVVMCCLIRTPEMITQIQETTTSGNTKIIIENFKKSEGMVFTSEKSSIEIDNTVNIICLIFKYQSITIIQIIITKLKNVNF